MDGEISHALLLEDLQDLDQIQPGLSLQAGRYLLEREGAEVLTTLASLPGAAEALGLLGDWHRTNRARHRYYEQQPMDEPAVLVRLARLQAAVRQGRPGPKPQRPASCWGPEGWLEDFLQDVSRMFPYRIRGRDFPPHNLKARTVEAMLELEGRPPDELYRILWRTPEPSSGDPTYLLLTGLQGFKQGLEARPQVIGEGLEAPAASVRSAVVERLIRLEVPLAPYFGELSRLAVGPAKTVRETVETALRRDLRASLEGISQSFPRLTPGEREQAVRLMLRLDPQQARGLLESLRTEERHPKVRAALEAALLQAQGAVPGEKGLPVDEALLGLGRPLCEPVRQSLTRALREAWLARPAWQRKVDPDVGDLEVRIERLLGLVDRASLEPAWPEGHWGHELIKHLQPVLNQSALGLAQAVRILVQTRLVFQGEGGWLLTPWAEGALDQFRDSHPGTGLREISAAFEALGLSAELAGRTLLLSQHQIWSHWPSEATWPYFQEHPELLAQGLTVKFHPLYSDPRWGVRRVLEILASLPPLPAILHESLFETALTGFKDERPLAARALEKLPGFEARVLTALNHGQQEVRTQAALWLARLRLPQAEAPLRKALAKEKLDLPKAAMMRALEALGVDLQEFLDRALLHAEATKGLKAGIPKALSWFPFKRLPQLHWKDSPGDPVEPAILQWLVVRCHQLKTPEPSPLVELHAGLLQERHQLGRFLLKTWIAHDTRPAYTLEQAQHKAQQQAPYWLGQHPGRSLAQIEADRTRSLLQECAGSAVADKGLLALAAACGGDMAAPIERFLKTYYGTRAAQCRALLTVLAHGEHLGGIQLLLSVAQRFRTRGIQEEAARLAGQLAERKGWSVAQMADRTVSDLGLDSRGELQLDYGPRSFVARLNEKLELELVDLKALPEARALDDPDLVKAAKSAFSAAQKELKSLLKRQRDRLHEAMCGERYWSVEDWQAFLLGHPVLGPCCRRLLWTAGATTFRPLEDGSLTDSADCPVELPADSRIQLAHPLRLSAQEAQAWQTHLVDYGVEPLFVQVGPLVYRLPREREGESEISDFQGHVLEAFRLRSRATSLGYNRGQTEGGGWFYHYRKTFLELGWETVLNFSGNSLPEENRKVALTSLSFVSQGRPRELSQVPAVLLSEAWNDMRSLASQGSGFDPDWEKLSL